MSRATLCTPSRGPVSRSPWCRPSRPSATWTLAPLPTMTSPSPWHPACPWTSSTPLAPVTTCRTSRRTLTRKRSPPPLAGPRASTSTTARSPSTPSLCTRTPRLCWIRSRPRLSRFATGSALPSTMPTPPSACRYSVTPVTSLTLASATRPLLTLAPPTPTCTSLASPLPCRRSPRLPSRTRAATMGRSSSATFTRRTSLSPACGTCPSTLVCACTCRPSVDSTAPRAIPSSSWRWRLKVVARAPRTTTGPSSAAPATASRVSTTRRT
mmetsp:Transcript_16613/g.51955  ORF Transcript_16613/g.51955 Transcript_16613/m.51955 type:complete len:268 (+) Transcript_16613:720-1523(+)